MNAENKQQALSQIKNLIGQYRITKEDVLTLFMPASVPQRPSSKQLDMSNMLHYIGGIIIFLGIGILIWQNWDMLNAFTKILSSLGSGVALYMMGALASRKQDMQNTADAFYFASGLILPLGISVTFDLAGVEVNAAGYQLVISGILFCTFFLSFLVLKRNVFLIFSIVFATWLFFSFTGFLLEGTAIFSAWKMMCYRVLIVALTYLLLGYYFSQTEQNTISRVLYNFGIFGFLGAALMLGGFKPESNMFWELIYPLLVFAALFAGVYLRNKNFLVMATFYLMVFILKISFEYFVDSLGWPFALVLAGFLLMGAGFFSLQLKRKYL